MLQPTLLQLYAFLLNSKDVSNENSIERHRKIQLLLNSHSRRIMEKKTLTTVAIVV